MVQNIYMICQQHNISLRLT